MQYAQVIPNTKTSLDNSLFTYKIPAELLPEIKIGSIVKIPFGTRKIEGLVLDIKRKKSPQIINKKIKNIFKIIGYLEITPTQKKLALWLSQYYKSPLSEIFFTLLPFPPQRPSKIKIQIPNPKVIKNDLLFKNRFYYFKNEIKKALKNQKQIIILFPQIEIAEKFYYYLAKLYSKKIVLFHSNLSKQEKWQNYQKILQNEAKIITGSKNAIFAPVQKLDQIIIDSADNNSFKQDQSPRYDARKVAEKLAQIARAKLTFLTPALPLDFYFPAQKRKITWGFPKTFSPQIQIVNLTNEAKFGNFDLLSETAKTKIIQNFQKKKLSLLFINKKGSASLLMCRDCQYFFKCPDCETNFTYHFQYGKSSHILVCHHCGFRSQKFHHCPNCHGINLKFLGGGTEKIEAEVRKILPMAKILRIEKDEAKTDLFQKYDIVIGTQKIFTDFYKATDLVVAVLPDLSLQLPDFRACERTFQQLKWLKLYSKKDFLIQTHFPKHYIFQALKQNNDHIFYNQELTIREKEGYPPYAKIIKLNFADISLTRTETEAQKISQKLKKMPHPGIQILGPAPAYFLKKADKFYWQIILKGRSPEKILPQIPKNWKIDIDPVSLL